MGSQKIQGELWGKRPKDWASIQESTVNSGYETIAASIQPYIQKNGHVVYNNKFRVVISEKRNAN